MKFLDYLLIAFVVSAVIAAIVSIVKKAKNGNCCCGCSACKKYNTGDNKKSGKCPLCEEKANQDACCCKKEENDATHNDTKNN